MRAGPACFLLLLADCSAEAPPAPSLPAFRDTWSDRECGCLLGGDCPTPEAFEGESQDRGFECRWEDRAAARAVCSWEGRFRPDGLAGGGWSSWARTSVRLRHGGDKGWCWTERSTAPRD